MRRKAIWFFTCGLSALLSATAGAGTATDDRLQESLYSIAPSHYHRLDSELLGRRLHIVVKLPDGYSEATDEKYPTIYLLDGGATLPMLAGYYNYLGLEELVPEAILVALSYGAEDFEGGNYRSTDYTAPSEEREWWGGAPVFHDVLESELLPLIESNYRADSERRILFGQSIGGQFVLYSALTDPCLFWGRIASNPALHRNLPFFLQARSDEQCADAKLFVASASNDDPQFRGPAMAWIQHWNEQSDLPWNLRAVTIEGYGHFSLVTESFRQGMTWIFD